MKIRLTAALTIAGSSALLLAACSNATDAGGMSGMDHSGSSASSGVSTPSPSSSHNAQDVSFAQGMAMHHLQAIEMADTVLGKQGVDARVTGLATGIKNAQKPEIDEMNGWLTSWGEKTVSSSMSSMGGMAMGDGMMSQADMDALGNASGGKSSTLFLNQMIRHHQGAIDMARTEVRAGRSAAALALADTIIRDQTAQITQMKQLLQQI